MSKSPKFFAEQFILPLENCDHEETFSDFGLPGGGIIEICKRCHKEIRRGVRMNISGVIKDFWEKD